MRSIFKPLLAVAVIAVAIFAVSAFKQTQKRNQTPVTTPTQTEEENQAIDPAFGQIEESNQAPALPGTFSEKKIQVAVLLDVSNSMDGLIDQAKAQLWTMVSTLGRVRCENNASPKVEIALYEYGTPRNPSRKGYIRQINNFISDLDSLSENLFALTTNGGDEYCGHVIYSSTNELEWDKDDNSYKVIFIAGNESFRQGEINFKQACTAAKNKGVIVNTIYCGDREQGIREFWNLAGECGNGSFSNINQDQKIEDIATPFDDEISQLNDKLNSTYIAYGEKGVVYYNKQKTMDQANAGISRKAAIKRAEAKSNSKVYNNASWDLVDRAANDEAVLEKIDRKTLPDSLKNKTTTELKMLVKEKSNERVAIQTKIVDLNLRRQQYINDEKKKTSIASVATLETEVERIIKEQVQRFKMTVE